MAHISWTAASCFGILR